MPTFIPPHPRVLCTREDVGRARALTDQGGWPAAALQHLLTDAGETVDIPDTFGETADGQLNGKLIGVARAAALASLLTDAPQHRDRALDIMRRLSRHYAEWPIVDGGRGIPGYNLSETRFILGLAEVYDLLAADPLDESDEALFRSAVEAARPVCDEAPHATCGNHNTWQMVARLGMGIALGNMQDIHDALYGCPWDGYTPWRYGLVHQLRHDFLADGLHWERAPGYHFYTLMAVTEMAVLLGHVGVDLWHAELPALTENDGADLHRAYGPKGTRCIKAAFDAPLYQTFPNGDFPLVHDSGLAHLRGIDIWGMLYHAAYEAYDDPRYAWLIHLNEDQNPPNQRKHPDLPTCLQDRPHLLVRFRRTDWPSGQHPLDTEGTALSQTGAHRNHCTLFPTTGVAILRTGDVEHAGPSVSINYGPHSAGHQAPAMLHIDLHAADQRRTDAPRSGGYEDATHLTWMRTTFAHNTVVVDGKSQFPYDFETESIWEADQWRDRHSDGTLVHYQTDGGFKAVRAANEAVYPGVRLDRTVILTDRAAIDVFRVISADQHVYDWPMHGVGVIDVPDNATPMELGAGRGYRHLSSAHEWSAPGPIAEATWGLRNGAVTRAAIALPDGASLIAATDPTCDKPHLLGSHPDEDTRRTTVIVRAPGASLVFISHWQFDQDEPIAFAVDQADPQVQVVLRTGTGSDQNIWRLPFEPEPVVREA